VSLFATEPQVDVRRAALAVRLKQFAAVLDQEKTVRIARAIVGLKIRAEGHGRIVERAWLAALRAAGTTDEVRRVEAASGQVWWKKWDGFEMRFAGPAVAAEWRSWPGRYIGQAAREVRGAASAIYSQECDPSVPGVAELRGGSVGGENDQGCDR
jgi:hypothetical protein